MAKCIVKKSGVTERYIASDFPYLKTSKVFKLQVGLRFAIDKKQLEAKDEFNNHFTSPNNNITLDVCHAPFERNQSNATKTF